MHIFKILTFIFLSALCLKLKAVDLGEIDAQEQRVRNSYPVKHLIEEKSIDATPKAIKILLSRLSEAGVFYSSYEEFQNQWKQHDTLQDKLMILTPFITTELLLFAKNYNALSTLELVGGFIGSYLLADLTTGIVHFSLDHLDWKKSMWPALIRENLIITQWHHDAPSARGDSSYWDISRSSYFLSYIFLAFSGGASLCGYDTASYVISLTALMMAQGFYVHTALAHGKLSKKPFVKLLQDCSIILPPKHHNVHHKDPQHASHFCILTGHADVILDLAISVCSSAYNFFKKWCEKKPRK